MCSLCNSSYMVIENRVHAFTYIHSYFSSRFSASKIACGDITFITNFDFADSDLSLCIVHIVPFVCCIIHVLSILLVDCCMTYIILEKSLLKYCAHWLLYNFDFADSDLSLYIVHIVPFVCCIIHVSSPSWLIVVWHISYWKNPYWNTAPIDCCIILILPIQIYPCALFISCHLFVVSFLYYPSCWLIVVWHISYWKNHYWNTAPIDCCIMLILNLNDILVDCCILYHIGKNPYWNTAPIDCCIILILQIQIHPYTWFITCHLFVVSSTYHPSWLIVVLTYIILVCLIYDRHHAANGWFALFITSAYFWLLHIIMCCVFIYRIHVLPKQKQTIY